MAHELPDRGTSCLKKPVTAQSQTLLLQQTRVPMFLLVKLGFSVTLNVSACLVFRPERHRQKNVLTDELKAILLD